MHVLELLEVLSDLVGTTILNIWLVVALTANLANLLWLELMMQLSKLVTSSLYIESLTCPWSLSIT